MAGPGCCPPIAGPAEPRGHGLRPGLVCFGCAVVPLLLAASGCIQGSLATRTGPNGPQLWSADKRQEAHVNETVPFSFILTSPPRDRPLDPYGYADYCVASIGDQRVLCEADLQGHFRFSHRLAEAKPGDETKVTATAYRQYGNRDFIQVGGSWLHGDSPIDEPDRKVCSDSITLRVYQARVEMRLPGGASPFDFESGKLQLLKYDGSVRLVFLDRPGRPGFIASGPDDAGGYTVVYAPDGDELNPSGQTPARFTVYDLAGHPHTVEMMIPTP